MKNFMDENFLLEMKEELDNDIQIDQMNLLDKEFMVPTLKHKWVFRSIDLKNIKYNLEKEKKDIKAEFEKKYNEKVSLNKRESKILIDKKINEMESIKRINEKLDRLSLVIEYFEKIEKIVLNLNYDLKNINDTIKMET
jgi:hypothetical protein